MWCDRGGGGLAWFLYRLSSGLEERAGRQRHDAMYPDGADVGRVVHVRHQPHPEPALAEHETGQGEDRGGGANVVVVGC